MSDISKYKRGSSVGSRSALYIEADWLGLNSALCETAVSRAVSSGANEGRHSSAEVGGIPHWSLSFHIQFICTKTTCWEELTRPCHYKKKEFFQISHPEMILEKKRRGIKVSWNTCVQNGCLFRKSPYLSSYAQGEGISSAKRKTRSNEFKSCFN